MMKILDSAVRERAQAYFDARVERQQSGCLVWKGPVVARIARSAMHGFRTSAAKLSYFLTFGSLPRGKTGVSTKCLTPLCVEPDHLIATNNDDVSRLLETKGRKHAPIRGRLCPGEGNINAKLREEDVRTIRRRRAAGEPLSLVAKDYPHINPRSISKITSRKAWRHVK